MCTFRRILFSGLVFLLSGNIVNAASRCDTTTTANLNREVVNIKANYEEKEREVTLTDDMQSDECLTTGNCTPLIENYFQVNILNLTENFYIEVINDVSKEKMTYTSANAVDGVVSFEWNNLLDVTTFTIKVYSSEATGCAGEAFRTLYVTLPRLNEFYDYSVCSLLPDYYLCQKYVSFDEVDFEVFSKGIDKKLAEMADNSSDKDNDGNKDKWFDNTTDFIKEHKVAFIAGGIILVAAISVVVVVIIRKRRREVIWKRS